MLKEALNLANLKALKGFVQPDCSRIPIEKAAESAWA
jgi:hypothetical protein